MPKFCMHFTSCVSVWVPNLYSMKDHILYLKRSESKVRQSGDGSPQPSPGAERLVACWGDKAPEIVGLGQSTRSWTVFCYLKKQLLTPVLCMICLDYLICVHGGSVCQNAPILAAEGHVLCTSCPLSCFEPNDTLLMPIFQNIPGKLVQGLHSGFYWSLGCWRWL